jgi:hypothetical protein
MYDLISPSNDDGFAAIPQTSASLLRGKIIKFDAGDYFCGGDIFGAADLVATGAKAFWARWCEQHIAEVREGPPHPDRSELGHHDRLQWEPGLNGEPADPWHDTRHLYLIEQTTAEEFTFVTSSFGGRSAVAELSRQICSVRAAHPRACPIVELTFEKMPTRYGLKKRPKFRVRDWIGTDIKREPTSQPLLTSALNDEIPF